MLRLALTVIVIIGCACSSWLSPLGVSLLSADERPNFLIIMADDCTYSDLPLYGGQNALTPNLDKLARRGLTFDRAFVSSAMCQVCRAELFTGRYPLANGCCWNHSASRPETKSLPHLLRPLGYRVGIAGKVHVEPATAFPFDRVAGFDANCVRAPTRQHDLKGIADYMSKAEHDSPFCLVVALVEPHVPWVMGDASAYPPERLKLPRYLADTPATRKHFADYLAEITYMDGQVGEILEVLERSGAADETVVIFSSEQGSQFPGCKWTNWNTGLHTALVVSWPGRVAQGERTDALVQYADVVPTLLELAGGRLDVGFDGSSFAEVLNGKSAQHRDFAFAMHNNVPEGPPYPIRSVTDGEYRYIRNLRSDELYIERHLMGGGRLNNPYWSTWLGAGSNRQDVYALTKRYMLRPPEQLYWTAKDPYELDNIVSDPKFDKTKARLITALDEWMKDQGDPGAEVDTQEALQAAREGKHRFGARQ